MGEILYARENSGKGTANIPKRIQNDLEPEEENIDAWMQKERQIMENRCVSKKQN